MKCATRYCRNERAMRLNGQPYGARCHKCRKRAWMANQPLRYRYDNHRTHARARGLSFTIDFETWCYFATATGYADFTGPFATCLTIDRIDNERGYEPDNIQILTRAANSSKQGRMDRMRSFSKAA